MTDPDPTPEHDRAGSTVSPVLAIARSEVRSRWLSLLLIGLLAGVVGAVAISGVALARRTTTAYERLGEATKVDDARGFVTGYPELADEIEALPMVTARWVGGIGVSQIEGQNTFLGIVAGPREPSPLIKPLVLDGRLPEASSDPDVIEVVLREDFQREVGVPLGAEFPVTFLTLEDYYRFDTGFEGGSPHGPTATLQVVGTVRQAGGFTTVPPAFASGDALASHPEAFVGVTYFVRLDGGAAGFPDFRAAVDEVIGDRELPPEGQEFSVVDVYDTSAARATVDNTALLLGRALMAFALATAFVGGVAVVQALARHHTASAPARDVELALGLTRSQQTVTRLLTGLVPAVIAAILATAGSLAAARIEPIGAIYLYEPRPGTSINVILLALGVGIVLFGVLAATALTGMSRRRRSDSGVRESSFVSRITSIGGSPPTVLGLRFALEPGRGARSVPVRSAITGAIVGIAGVVAGLVFISSLDRLIESPSRSGIPYDVGVADVTADELAVVLDDPLVGDVAVSEGARVSIEGIEVDGHAFEDLRGAIDIGIEDGRLPRTPDEIALGLRVAQDLGVGIGDTVTVRRPNGDAHDLAVVGTAVVPPLNGEELGLNAILTPDGLAENGLVETFSEAAVNVAPGGSVEDLVELLASHFEADTPPMPATVQNLEELGGLPTGVAAIVGSVAVLALANALVVAVRRRRRDLAVLRAMGFTRRQTATSVVVMALAIVAIGVVVGVPVGMAIGATLWRITASGAFVLSDASFRWELLLLPALGSVLIALAAALIPARQAARQSPATGLQAE